MKKYTDEEIKEISEDFAKFLVAKKSQNKEPDWERRCQELIKAIDFLSETSVHSASEDCNIPTAEAWDFLEKAAQHYSSPKRVGILPIPALHEDQL